MTRFPKSYSISGAQQSSLFRPLLPPSPSSRRSWQATQVQQTPMPPRERADHGPKPYPISSAGPQPGLRTPPSSRPTSPVKQPEAQPAPPVAPPGYSFQHTASSLPSPPQNCPIPGSVWNIVNEIKACRYNKWTKLPYRADLKAARFRQHFTSAGVLRPESELAQYRGDARLFQPAVWEFLCSQMVRETPKSSGPLTNSS